MSQLLTYPIELTPVEEGGYVVTFPGLSIVTEGDTKEEAVSNAKEAFLCHLEGEMKERGENPSAHIVMMKVELSDTLLLSPL